MPQASATQTIAAAVKEARRSQGLDQTSLALVADVGVRTLHRIEHGEPTVRLDRVLAVLDALGLEVDIRPRAR
ncbi:helix-turn-helix domain-containing protein [Svornostia abyssi]|uniref:Helix-turn-helix domain-containing protein n=1 Tax=Svornostia abyssi TaxID=2898438 RepID=A0ABY5PEI4_9ACTN|nr:helix-turn-helix domain-containing protein [Parviterribacteraceae bacterium J379]